MAGRGGFVLARARSGAGVLAALALVTAVAAALVVGVVGAVRAFEAAGALDAVSVAEGDRDRIIVRFESDAGAGGDRAGAIADALRALGASGALSVAESGDGSFELRPNPARFSGDAVAVLVAGLPDLEREVRVASGESVQVWGGLRATLSALSDELPQRRGPTSVAIGVVGLLSLVVVAAASVEPVRLRWAERALLRARGMSRLRLIAIALAEAVPTLALGAAAGVAAGMGATWLWSGTVMPAVLGLVVAGAIVLAGALTVTIATARGLDRRPARGDLVAGISGVVLLGVVAVLGAVQFWQTGTPVIVQGSGRVVIDPLIALAPALVLALFALLAVVVGAPIAGLAGRIAARGRGVVPVLPLRLASRRTNRHALTTGAVAFAAATTTLSLALLGTLTTLGNTPEAIRVGADVRVTSIPEDAERSAVTGLTGVDQSMRARVLAVRGADDTFSLLGAQSQTLGTVMLDAGGAIDPTALAEAIAVPPAGVALPPSASSLEVTIGVPEGRMHQDEDGTQGPALRTAVDVRLSLVDETGVVTHLAARNYPTGPGQDDRDILQSIPLPDGGPWRLLAIDAFQPVNYQSTGTVSATVAVAVAGQPLDLSEFRGAGDAVEAEENGIRLEVREPDRRSQRPDVTRAIAGDMPARFPVAITAGLADSLNASIGTELSLRMASFPFTVDVEVAELIPVLPGVPDASGVLIDMTALALASPDPLPENELWLSTDDPAGVAEAADAAIGGVRVDVTDPRAAAKAVETALAFVLAACGAVLLAIVVLVLRRSRAGGDVAELGILAVLGIGRARAVRVRSVEDGFAVIIGVLGGVAAGWVTAWLIVPNLARAAYAGMAEEYPIRVDAPVLLLVGVLVAVTAVLVAIAASVRAPRALAPILREAE